MDVLQELLENARSHRTCEYCGQDMICLGPDKDRPPAGIWVHSVTLDKVCMSLEKEALVSELAAIDAQATADATRQDIVCPFCEEEDFDLIGLKSHLLKGHCDDFEKTERLP